MQNSLQCLENSNLLLLTAPNSASVCRICPTSKRQTLLCAAEIDVEVMSIDELRKLTLHLRDSLKAREVQLMRKFEEVANMQEVTHRLMVRQLPAKSWNAVISHPMPSHMRKLLREHYLRP